ncbi:MAG: glycosyltransferase [Bacteroidia bacterium]
MVKTIIISVISDLVTDQRVNRSAWALTKNGHRAVLVGRKLKKSIPLDRRPYKTFRFSLWFEKGFIFYATYNIRLFFYLLFHHADVLLANDLDTLPANYLVSKLKNIPLVYDSHEYYTGVPELEYRPFIQKIWKTIEKFIFPQLTRICTVNDSIAKLYSDEYKKNIVVVRNISDASFEKMNFDAQKLKAETGIDKNKKIIILQGSGINIERGAEEAVEAMKYVDNAVLLIIGGGDVMPFLKEIVHQNNLEQKVIFKDRMPYHQLMQYTLTADVGLSLDKGTNLNYRFSLPNKLFDYIYANVPVLGSQVVEVKKIIDQYKIGSTIENHNPVHIAEKLSFMLADETRVREWKKNLEAAAKELTWAHEEKKFLTLFDGIL